MAEHDEIVTKAAEAAAKDCVPHPSEVLIADVALTLAGYFVEARAAEREAVLEEAARLTCWMCDAGKEIRLDETAGGKPIYMHDRGPCAAQAIHRALRSKPKEPA